MSQNGWPNFSRPPSTYFTAPNGKRVYVANEDVATIFEYVTRQWNERIEKLPAATYNIGDPAVRKGYIVIHSYRPPGSGAGIGDKSNHRSGTGCDILGDRHHYAPTCRRGGCGYPAGPHDYISGFSDAQEATLREIRREVGKNSRGMYVLRLGIDFAPAYFDAMHFEIAPGVTATDVKAAAAAIRAAEVVIDLTEIHRMLLDLGYTADESGVRAAQRDHGLTPDGIPGPITTAALEATMSKVLDKLDDITGRLSTLYDRQSNLDTAHNNIMGEVRSKASADQVAALTEVLTAFQLVPLTNKTADVIGTKHGTTMPLARVVDTIMRDTRRTWAAAAVAIRDAIVAEVTRQNPDADPDAVMAAATTAMTTALQED